MLDWPAASTFGMIALLARWPGLSPRALRDNGARERAKELLKGGGARLAFLHLAVGVEQHLEPPWPADEENIARLFLGVDTKCLVDLSRWTEATGALDEYVAKLWWKHLVASSSMQPGALAAKLLDLLLNTVGVASCRGLFD